MPAVLFVAGKQFYDSQSCHGIVLRIFYEVKRNDNGDRKTLKWMTSPLRLEPFFNV